MVTGMILVQKSGKFSRMKTPADVLEELIRHGEAAGRWKSVAGFFRAAGIKNRQQLSAYRNRLQANDNARLATETMRLIAHGLGMTIDELERRMYGEQASAGGAYPSRDRAVAAARDLQVPEAAIQAVLKESPPSDPGHWYWFRRIESEAIRIAPLTSAQA